MNQQETTIGDLSIADLDHKSATIAAQGIEATADGIEALGKAQYMPAVRFLRQFAGVLYDIAIARAQADGLPMRRTREQAQTALDERQKRLLN